MRIIVFFLSFFLVIHEESISRTIATSESDFDTSCVALPLSSVQHNLFNCDGERVRYNCSVENFSWLANINGNNYYYGIYKTYTPRDSNTPFSNGHEVVLYQSQRDTNMVKAVWSYNAFDEVEYFEPPTLVKTIYGWIFHTFVSGGNGGFDNGDYYLLKSHSWTKLNIPDWSKLFKSKIPRTHWLCRGNIIDLQTMTMIYYVFKSSDACCCPTGGTVSATLKIQGNAIIAKNIEYEP